MLNIQVVLKDGCKVFSFFARDQFSKWRTFINENAAKVIYKLY